MPPNPHKGPFKSIFHKLTLEEKEHLEHITKHNAPHSKANYINLLKKIKFLGNVGKDKFHHEELALEAEKGIKEKKYEKLSELYENIKTDELEFRLTVLFGALSRMGLEEESLKVLRISEKLDKPQKLDLKDKEFLDNHEREFHEVLTREHLGISDSYYKGSKKNLTVEQSVSDYFASDPTTTIQSTKKRKVAIFRELFELLKESKLSSESLGGKTPRTYVASWIGGRLSPESYKKIYGVHFKQALGILRDSSKSTNERNDSLEKLKSEKESRPLEEPKALEKHELLELLDSIKIFIKDRIREKISSVYSFGEASKRTGLTSLGKQKERITEMQKLFLEYGNSLIKQKFMELEESKVSVYLQNFKSLLIKIEELEKLQKKLGVNLSLPEAELIGLEKTMENLIGKEIAGKFEKIALTRGKMPNLKLESVGNLKENDRRKLIVKIIFDLIRSEQFRIPFLAFQAQLFERLGIEADSIVKEELRKTEERGAKQDPSKTGRRKGVAAICGRYNSLILARHALAQLEHKVQPEQIEEQKARIRDIEAELKDYEKFLIKELGRVENFSLFLTYYEFFGRIGTFFLFDEIVRNKHLRRGEIEERILKGTQFEETMQSISRLVASRARVDLEQVKKRAVSEWTKFASDHLEFKEGKIVSVPDLSEFEKKLHSIFEKKPVEKKDPKEEMAKRIFNYLVKKHGLSKKLLTLDSVKKAFEEIWKEQLAANPDSRLEDFEKDAGIRIIRRIGEKTRRISRDSKRIDLKTKKEMNLRLIKEKIVPKFRELQEKYNIKNVKELLLLVEEAFKELDSEGTNPQRPAQIEFNDFFKFLNAHLYVKNRGRLKNLLVPCSKLLALKADLVELERHMEKVSETRFLFFKNRGHAEFLRRKEHLERKIETEQKKLNTDLFPKMRKIFSKEYFDLFLKYFKDPHFSDSLHLGQTIYDLQMKTENISKSEKFIQNKSLESFVKKLFEMPDFKEGFKIEDIRSIVLKAWKTFEGKPNATLAKFYKQFNFGGFTLSLSSKISKIHVKGAGSKRKASSSDPIRETIQGTMEILDTLGRTYSDSKSKRAFESLIDSTTADRTGEKAENFMKCFNEVQDLEQIPTEAAPHIFEFLAARIKKGASSKEIITEMEEISYAFGDEYESFSNEERKNIVRDFFKNIIEGKRLNDSIVIAKESVEKLRRINLETELTKDGAKDADKFKVLFETSSYRDDALEILKRSKNLEDAKTKLLALYETKVIISAGHFKDKHAEGKYKHLFTGENKERAISIVRENPSFEVAKGKLKKLHEEEQAKKKLAEKKKETELTKSSEDKSSEIEDEKVETEKIEETKKEKIVKEEVKPRVLTRLDVEAELLEKLSEEIIDAINARLRERQFGYSSYLTEEEKRFINFISEGDTKLESSLQNLFLNYPSGIGKILFSEVGFKERKEKLFNLSSALSGEVEYNKATRIIGSTLKGSERRSALVTLRKTLGSKLLGKGKELLGKVFESKEKKVRRRVIKVPKGSSISKMTGPQKAELLKKTIKGALSKTWHTALGLRKEASYEEIVEKLKKERGSTKLYLAFESLIGKDQMGRYSKHPAFFDRNVLAEFLRNRILDSPRGKIPSVSELRETLEERIVEYNNLASEFVDRYILIAKRQVSTPKKKRELQFHEKLFAKFLEYRKEKRDERRGKTKEDMEIKEPTSLIELREALSVFSQIGTELYEVHNKYSNVNEARERLSEKLGRKVTLTEVLELEKLSTREDPKEKSKIPSVKEVFDEIDARLKGEIRKKEEKIRIKDELARKINERKIEFSERAIKLLDESGLKDFEEIVKKAIESYSEARRLEEIDYEEFLSDLETELRENHSKYKIIWKEVCNIKATDKELGEFFDSLPREDRLGLVFYSPNNLLGLREHLLIEYSRSLLSDEERGLSSNVYESAVIDASKRESKKVTSVHIGRSVRKVRLEYRTKKTHYIRKCKEWGKIELENLEILGAKEPEGVIDEAVSEFSRGENPFAINEYLELLNDSNKFEAKLKARFKKIVDLILLKRQGHIFTFENQLRRLKVPNNLRRTSVNRIREVLTRRVEKVELLNKNRTIKAIELVNSEYQTIKGVLEEQFEEDMENRIVQRAFEIAKESKVTPQIVNSAIEKVKSEMLEEELKSNEIQSLFDENFETENVRKISREVLDNYWKDTVEKKKKFYLRRYRRRVIRKVKKDKLSAEKLEKINLRENNYGVVKEFRESKQGKEFSSILDKNKKEIEEILDESLPAVLTAQKISMVLIREMLKEEKLETDSSTVLRIAVAKSGGEKTYFEKQEKLFTEEVPKHLKDIIKEIKRKEKRKLELLNKSLEELLDSGTIQEARRNKEYSLYVEVLNEVLEKQNSELSELEENAKKILSKIRENLKEENYENVPKLHHDLIQLRVNALEVFRNISRLKEKLDLKGKELSETFDSLVLFNKKTHASKISEIARMHKELSKLQEETKISLSKGSSVLSACRRGLEVKLDENNFSGEELRRVRGVRELAIASAEGVSKEIDENQRRLASVNARVELLNGIQTGLINTSKIMRLLRSHFNLEEARLDEIVRKISKGNITEGIEEFDNIVKVKDVSKKALPRTSKLQRRKSIPARSILNGLGWGKTEENKKKLEYALREAAKMQESSVGFRKVSSISKIEEELVDILPRKDAKEIAEQIRSQTEGMYEGSEFELAPALRLTIRLENALIQSKFESKKDEISKLLEEIKKLRKEGKLKDEKIDEHLQKVNELIGEESSRVKEITKELLNDAVSRFDEKFAREDVLTHVKSRWEQYVLWLRETHPDATPTKEGFLEIIKKDAENASSESNKIEEFTKATSIETGNNLPMLISKRAELESEQQLLSFATNKAKKTGRTKAAEVLEGKSIGVKEELESLDLEIKTTQKNQEDDLKLDSKVSEFAKRSAETLVASLQEKRETVLLDGKFDDFNNLRNKQLLSVIIIESATAEHKLSAAKESEKILDNEKGNALQAVERNETGAKERLERLTRLHEESLVEVQRLTRELASSKSIEELLKGIKRNEIDITSLREIFKNVGLELSKELEERVRDLLPEQFDEVSEEIKRELAFKERRVHSVPHEKLDEEVTLQSNLQRRISEFVERTSDFEEIYGKENIKKAKQIAKELESEVNEEKLEELYNEFYSLLRSETETLIEKESGIVDFFREIKSHFWSGFNEEEIEDFIKAEFAEFVIAERAEGRTPDLDAFRLLMSRKNSELLANHLEQSRGETEELEGMLEENRKTIGKLENDLFAKELHEAWQTDEKAERIRREEEVAVLKKDIQELKEKNSKLELTLSKRVLTSKSARTASIAGKNPTEIVDSQIDETVKKEKENLEPIEKEVVLDLKETGKVDISKLKDDINNAVDKKNLPKLKSSMLSIEFSDSSKLSHSKDEKTYKRAIKWGKELGEHQNNVRTAWNNYIRARITLSEIEKLILEVPSKEAAELIRTRNEFIESISNFSEQFENAWKKLEEHLQNKEIHSVFPEWKPVFERMIEDDENILPRIKDLRFSKKTSVDISSSELAIGQDKKKLLTYNAIDKASLLLEENLDKKQEAKKFLPVLRKELAVSAESLAKRGELGYIEEDHNSRLLQVLREESKEIEDKKSLKEKQGNVKNALVKYKEAKLALVLFDRASHLVSARKPELALALTKTREELAKDIDKARQDYVKKLEELSKEVKKDKSLSKKISDAANKDEALVNWVERKRTLKLTLTRREIHLIGKSSRIYSVGMSVSEARSLIEKIYREHSEELRENFTDSQFLEFIGNKLRSELNKRETELRKNVELETTKGELLVRRVFELEKQVDFLLAKNASTLELKSEDNLIVANGTTGQKVELLKRKAVQMRNSTGPELVKDANELGSKLRLLTTSLESLSAKKASTNALVKQSKERQKLLEDRFENSEVLLEQTKLIPIVPEEEKLNACRRIIEKIQRGERVEASEILSEIESEYDSQKRQGKLPSLEKKFEIGDIRLEEWLQKNLDELKGRMLQDFEEFRREVFISRIFTSLLEEMHDKGVKVPSRLVSEELKLRKSSEKLMLKWKKSIQSLDSFVKGAKERIPELSVLSKETKLLTDSKLDIKEGTISPALKEESTEFTENKKVSEWLTEFNEISLDELNGQMNLSENKKFTKEDLEEIKRNLEQVSLDRKISYSEFIEIVKNIVEVKLTLKAVSKEKVRRAVERTDKLVARKHKVIFAEWFDLIEKEEKRKLETELANRLEIPENMHSDFERQYFERLLANLQKEDKGIERYKNIRTVDPNKKITFEEFSRALNKLFENSFEATRKLFEENLQKNFDEHVRKVSEDSVLEIYKDSEKAKNRLNEDRSINKASKVKKYKSWKKLLKKNIFTEEFFEKVGLDVDELDRFKKELSERLEKLDHEVSSTRVTFSEFRELILKAIKEAYSEFREPMELPNKREISKRVREVASENVKFSDEALKKLPSKLTEKLDEAKKKSREKDKVRKYLLTPDEILREQRNFDSWLQLIGLREIAEEENGEKRLRENLANLTAKKGATFEHSWLNNLAVKLGFKEEKSKIYFVQKMKVLFSERDLSKSLSFDEFRDHLNSLLLEVHKKTLGHLREGSFPGKTFERPGISIKHKEDFSEATLIGYKGENKRIIDSEISRVSGVEGVKSFKGWLVPSEEKAQLTKGETVKNKWLEKIGKELGLHGESLEYFINALGRRKFIASSEESKAMSLEDFKETLEKQVRDVYEETIGRIHKEELDSQGVLLPAENKREDIVRKNIDVQFGGEVLPSLEESVQKLSSEAVEGLNKEAEDVTEATRNLEKNFNWRNLPVSKLPKEVEVNLVPIEVLPKKVSKEDLKQLLELKEQEHELARALFALKVLKVLKEKGRFSGRKEAALIRFTKEKRVEFEQLFDRVRERALDVYEALVREANEGEKVLLLGKKTELEKWDFNIALNKYLNNLKRAEFKDLSILLPLLEGPKENLGIEGTKTRKPKLLVDSKVKRDILVEEYGLLDKSRKPVALLTVGEKRVSKRLENIQEGLRVFREEHSESKDAEKLSKEVEETLASQASRISKLEEQIRRLDKEAKEYSIEKEGRIDSEVVDKYKKDYGEKELLEKEDKIASELEKRYSKIVLSEKDSERETAKESILRKIKEKNSDFDGLLEQHKELKKRVEKLLDEFKSESELRDGLEEIVGEARVKDLGFRDRFTKRVIRRTKSIIKRERGTLTSSDFNQRREVDKGKRQLEGQLQRELKVVENFKKIAETRTVQKGLPLALSELYFQQALEDYLMVLDREREESRIFPNWERGRLLSWETELGRSSGLEENSEAFRSFKDSIAEKLFELSESKEKIDMEEFLERLRRIANETRLEVISKYGLKHLEKLDESKFSRVLENSLLPIVRELDPELNESEFKKYLDAHLDETVSTGYNIEITRKDFDGSEVKRTKTFTRSDDSVEDYNKRVRIVRRLTKKTRRTLERYGPKEKLEKINKLLENLESIEGKKDIDEVHRVDKNALSEIEKDLRDIIGRQEELEKRMKENEKRKEEVLSELRSETTSVEEIMDFNLEEFESEDSKEAKRITLVRQEIINITKGAMSPHEVERRLIELFTRIEQGRFGTRLIESKDSVLTKNEVEIELRKEDEESLEEASKKDLLPEKRKKLVRVSFKRTIRRLKKKARENIVEEFSSNKAFGENKENAKENLDHLVRNQESLSVQEIRGLLEDQVKAHRELLESVKRIENVSKKQLELSFNVAWERVRKEAEIPRDEKASKAFVENVKGIAENLPTAMKGTALEKVELTEEQQQNLARRLLELADSKNEKVTRSIVVIAARDVVYNYSKLLVFPRELTHSQREKVLKSFIEKRSDLNRGEKITLEESDVRLLSDSLEKEEFTAEKDLLVESKDLAKRSARKQVSEKRTEKSTKNVGTLHVNLEETNELMHTLTIAVERLTEKIESLEGKIEIETKSISHYIKEKELVNERIVAAKTGLVEIEEKVRQIMPSEEKEGHKEIKDLLERIENLKSSTKSEEILKLLSEIEKKREAAVIKINGIIGEGKDTSSENLRKLEILLSSKRLDKSDIQKLEEEHSKLTQNIVKLEKQEMGFLRSQQEMREKNVGLKEELEEMVRREEINKEALLYEKEELIGNINLVPIRSFTDVILSLTKLVSENFNSERTNSILLQSLAESAREIEKEVSGLKTGEYEDPLKSELVRKIAELVGRLSYVKKFKQIFTEISLIEREFNKASLELVEKSSNSESMEKLVDSERLTCSEWFSERRDRVDSSETLPENWRKLVEEELEKSDISAEDKAGLVNDVWRELGRRENEVIKLSELIGEIKRNITEIKDGVLKEELEEATSGEVNLKEGQRLAPEVFDKARDSIGEIDSESARDIVHGTWRKFTEEKDKVTVEDYLEEIKKEAHKVGLEKAREKLEEENIPEEKVNGLIKRVVNEEEILKPSEILEKVTLKLKVWKEEIANDKEVEAGKISDAWIKSREGRMLPADMKLMRSEFDRRTKDLPFEKLMKLNKESIHNLLEEIKDKEIPKTVRVEDLSKVIESVKEVKTALEEGFSELEEGQKSLMLGQSEITSQLIAQRMELHNNIQALLEAMEKGTSSQVESIKELLGENKESREEFVNLAKRLNEAILGLRESNERKLSEVSDNIREVNSILQTSLEELRKGNKLSEKAKEELLGAVRKAADKISKEIRISLQKRVEEPLKRLFKSQYAISRKLGEMHKENLKARTVDQSKMLEAIQGLNERIESIGKIIQEGNEENIERINKLLDATQENGEDLGYLTNLSEILNELTREASKIASGNAQSIQLELVKIEKQMKVIEGSIQTIARDESVKLEEIVKTVKKSSLDLGRTIKAAIKEQTQTLKEENGKVVESIDSVKLEIKALEDSLLETGKEQHEATQKSFENMNLQLGRVGIAIEKAIREGNEETLRIISKHSEELSNQVRKIKRSMTEILRVSTTIVDKTGLISEGITLSNAKLEKIGGELDRLTGMLRDGKEVQAKEVTRIISAIEEGSKEITTFLNEAQISSINATLLNISQSLGRIESSKAPESILESIKQLSDNVTTIGTKLHESLERSEVRTEGSNKILQRIVDQLEKLEKLSDIEQLLTSVKNENKEQVKKITQLLVDLNKEVFESTKIVSEIKEEASGQSKQVSKISEKNERIEKILENINKILEEIKESKGKDDDNKDDDNDTPPDDGGGGPSKKPKSPSSTDPTAGSSVTVSSFEVSESDKPIERTRVVVNIGKDKKKAIKITPSHIKVSRTVVKEQVEELPKKIQERKQRALKKAREIMKRIKTKNKNKESNVVEENNEKVTKKEKDKSEKNGSAKEIKIEIKDEEKLKDVEDSVEFEDEIEIGKESEIPESYKNLQEVSKFEKLLNDSIESENWINEFIKARENLVNKVLEILKEGLSDSKKNREKVISEFVQFQNYLLNNKKREVGKMQKFWKGERKKRVPSFNFFKSQDADRLNRTLQLFRFLKNYESFMKAEGLEVSENLEDLYSGYLQIMNGFVKHLRNEKDYSKAVKESAPPDNIVKDLKENIEKVDSLTIQEKKMEPTIHHEELTFDEDSESYVLESNDDLL